MPLTLRETIHNVKVWAIDDETGEFLPGTASIYKGQTVFSIPPKEKNSHE
jgi:hypothetical protein